MIHSQTNAIAKLHIEQALDSMSDAFVLLDRDFHIAYVNPAAERIAGTPASAFLGRTHWEAWPASVGTEVERRYKLALRTGEAQHFQHHYVGAGFDVWLEINAYPGDHGLAIYYRDITRQKRERAETLRVERAYQAALSNTPDLIYVFDLNHRFTYANKALLTMWGRTAEEAFGKNCLELGYPDWHAAMHDREIEQVIATRAPIRGEVPFTGTHGPRVYEYIFAPVLGTDGSVEAVAGTTRDVTERRLAEEKVHAERGVLEELIQQAPAFMAVLRGPDHVIEITNALYQQLVGGRQVLGKTVREALPEAAEQGFVNLLDQVYKTGEPFSANNYPFDVVREPGKPLQRLYVNFVYQPLRELNGEISGIIVHGIDVTDARKAGEALLQGEKLAAAGRLAASIAHEINNPLEAITNLLFLIEADTSLASQTRSYLETAQAELNRVSQIATQTLRFYRQTTKAASIELREILESVVALYQRRLHDAGITLICRCSSTGPVMVFGGEVRQIAANLLGNALDASSRGGRIHLRERIATDWSTGRTGIRLTIADTGHGMDPDTLQQAFRPFFSTKSATGTGLGLWVIQEIVAKHAGRIRVRSSQDPKHRGTVFSVFLPEVAIVVDTPATTVSV